jgi:hypothetical protein
MMAQVTRDLYDRDKIIRDVHDISEIRAKTDLTPTQIEAINKARTLGTLFGADIIKIHTDDHMTLLKSLDRKSMNEFVNMARNKLDDRLEKAKGNFRLMG